MNKNMPQLFGWGIFLYVYGYDMGEQAYQFVLVLKDLDLIQFISSNEMSDEIKKLNSKSGKSKPKSFIRVPDRFLSG